MNSRKTAKSQFRWQLCVMVLVMHAGLAKAGNEQISVFTSLVPHAEFVSEIGGQLVKVETLVGPGHSPANYQPTPRQMAKLAEAQLYVAAEVPFEAGLLPKIEASYENLLLIGGENASHHAHDHAHHEHPHAWLDPLHVSALADSICAQLTILAPNHATQFEERRDQFKIRLANLNNKISVIMKPYQGQEFFVFHPAYGHFADRYGVVQLAVEDSGHEPGAQHLVKIIEQAQAANASVIIVQPQFSQRSAEAVAKSCDAEILVLDPLARDYEANLLHIAQMLANAWDAER